MSAAYHFIITIGRSGRLQATYHGTLTPEPDQTRRDIYRQVRDMVTSEHPDLANAAVVFFALEPNQL